MQVDYKKLILDELATLKDALVVFDSMPVGVVILCDESGVLMGVLTEGDVRRLLLDGVGLTAPVKQFINTDPVVAYEDMDRETATELLTDKIHFVPVVDKERKVVNLLYTDVRSFIPIATPLIGDLELKNVTEAVMSGWVSSQGKFISQFENQIADFCQVKHAIAVSNGTVALHLALTALGIRPGDEVIVPALTFIASSNSVTHCGATPVFVDVDEHSWCMCPEQLENAITPKTKAVMPVHLYGVPAEMQKINAICKKYGLSVVEDAAEAQGAFYGDQPVGSIGNAGCFSFFGNKMITTGEGGAITTNDDALAEKIRVLRDHGMSKSRRYWHDVVGYNYRMTNMQAALGVAQMERWDEIFNKKESIRKIYRELLGDYGLKEPKEYENTRSVCWMYTFLLPDDSFDRDYLLESMKMNNVDLRPTFHPIPSMPPYFEGDWEEKYPVSARVSRLGVNMPSFVGLTDDTIAYICRALIQIIKG